MRYILILLVVLAGCSRSVPAKSIEKFVREHGRGPSTDTECRDYYGGNGNPDPL